MKLRIESLYKLYFKHKIAIETADGEILKFIQEKDMVFISDIFKGNKEDLDYLIELGKELKTQDNLGTRKPLIFRIMDVKTVECTDNDYDFREINIEDGNCSYYSFTNEEIDKAVAYIKENYSYDEELVDVTYFSDLEEFCKDYDIEYTVSYYKKEIHYTGEFLTKKAAKEYLDRYLYRFNEPRIYIACGVENKELTKLTEILERLYEFNNREEIR